MDSHSQLISSLARGAGGSSSRAVAARRSLLGSSRRGSEPSVPWPETAEARCAADHPARKTRLKPPHNGQDMEKLTLHRLLGIFNSPINEEQAWAVCYQCAKHVQSHWREAPTACLRFTGVQSVELGKDGSLVGILPPPDGTTEPVRGEYELVQSLGVVVFQALDWGLGETEEQRLSPALEGLIERMTGSESDDENNGGGGENEADDEGIDAGDDDGPPPVAKVTLEDVLSVCVAHLPAPGDAASHYKAVCRALVTEALELISFLDKISKEKEKLKSTTVYKADEPDGSILEQLQRADWARLWIQVMRDLRRGVHLKKVEHIDFHQASVEFELTPYEMLMEDIRTRRYTLRQVLTNGDIPLRTKKDAHEIILEFIRSRPPLHPVKDRKLNSPPPKSPDMREQLLESIRSEPKLRPTPGRYVVETSRTKLKDDSGSPVATRKIIKPDLSLLMSNSFDEDDDDDEDDLFGEDRNHVSPGMLSPLSPLAQVLDHDHDALYGPNAWQQTVAYDLANLESSRTPPERRHSISVMETPPAAKPAPKRTTLECLSLTIEEVMHIRSVLTKAELECLVVDPELQALLAKGKVCFTCKETKFSLFGQWATKCKFCRRNVCSKCSSKMRIPTEHFEHVPVYTLSPSPLSPSSNKGIFTYEKTGSAPNSPELGRKKLGGSPPDTNLNMSRGRTLPSQPPAGRRSPPSRGPLGGGTRGPLGGGPRPLLQRAQTLARPLTGGGEAAGALQGPLMNICKDCKAMIVNIIRSSRTQLAKAPDMVKQKVQMPNLRRFHSFRTPRNFHLDLKPVYK